MRKSGDDTQVAPIFEMGTDEMDGFIPYHAINKMGSFTARQLSQVICIQMFHSNIDTYLDYKRQIYNSHIVLHGPNHK